MRAPHGRSHSMLPAAPYIFLSLFVFLFFPRPVPAAAQDSPQFGRPVSRAEGMAIVDAVADSQKADGQKAAHSRPEHGRRSKLDCSHLVNYIYNRAGFPYPYANSSDLYRGHSSFVRVTAPQSGDLIVWRGHVGLVVNPREHFFFSSLRSGMETEDYTSAYWRRHGAPRFYRYFLSTGDPILTARQSSPREDADPYFKTVSMSQSVNDDRIENRQRVLSADTFDGGRMPVNNSSAQQYSAIADEPVAGSTISLGTSHEKPTVKQLTDAISGWHQTTLAGLHAESLLRSRSTVIIFNQFHVEKVECKGKLGLAYVSIDSEGSLTSGVLNREVRHLEQKWELRRAKAGWILSPPAETVFVPRPVAVRIFAQQLARLAGASEAEIADSSSAEESRLASLLSSLLNP
jgi:hypothetical protein